MPGPGWYLIDDDEEREVVAALRERELSRYRFGQEDRMSRTMRFERAMAARLASPYVLATNSCTSALVAGLIALGVSPGDDVIVPGYTFVATMAAIRFVGARPVLAEVDESLTLDPNDVREKLTERTTVIVPVHMVGAPADMDALLAIAQEAGCVVLEDVAQACGALYRGRPLGSIGDAGAFSLNVSKVLTTGDGGLLATANEEVYRRAFGVHDHGYAPDRAGVVDGGPTWGLNLRMHELAAAMGLAQERRLDAVLKRCRQLKAAMRKELGDLSGVRDRVLHDNEECATAYVLVFDDAEHARRVARAMGGQTLRSSPKHHYATIAQLHPGLLSGPDGDLPRLPRTDDVLARSIALSVGLVDPYLGTLGDVTVRSTPEAAAATARHVRSVITRV